jgi:hypothetical protein
VEVELATTMVMAMALVVVVVVVVVVGGGNSLPPAGLPPSQWWVHKIGTGMMALLRHAFLLRKHRGGMFADVGDLADSM